MNKMMMKVMVMTMRRKRMPHTAMIKKTRMRKRMAHMLMVKKAGKNMRMTRT